MDAGAVAELLEKLRAGGVAKARLTFDGDAVDSIDVEFAPGPTAVAVSQFVDKDGKPVDLDAGAGPLTRDPDAALALESSDADLERANFGQKKAA
jgi:hypothetical protein